MTAEIKKTRLCHSVWTKPMKGMRWNVAGQLKQNLWLFALSAAYAKRAGAEMVLHTDRAGKKIFGFLPYDEIYPTLEGLDVHERFWAAGKIFAQEAEPLHSVHIDGDVFLKKQAVFDIIGDGDADLIVQMTERDITLSCPGSCYGKNLDLVLSALGESVPAEFDGRQDCAYNCGLVRFNNPELKKRYIDGYKSMLETCSNDRYFVKRLAADNNLCPDLILEQWWLKSVAGYYGYKTKTVLSGRGSEPYETAGAVGFEHPLGKQKYDLISVVKNRLLMIDPDLYCATVRQLSAIRF